MRFFQHEVEVVLKSLALIVFLMLVVLPAAWGYEQRQQARQWRSVACAFRIREVEQRAPILASLGHRPDPCAILERLGLELEVRP
jgi:hypothetical protein